MVEVDPRSPKKRKISHSQPRPGSPARRRSDGQSRTGAVSNRRVRPRPPRAIRTPGWKHQALTGSNDATSMAEASIRSSVRPSVSDGTVTPLSFVKPLLNQIWARNKNQHRMQSWWKTLSLLRKAVTHLSALESEGLLLQTQVQTLGGSTSARDVRKRFERETQLRQEQEMWRSWSREVLVPRAFLGFSSLVGDVQFANLGVVLIGLLADVVSVVGSPTSGEEIDDGTGTQKTREIRKGGGDFAAGKARSLMATSLRITGLQSGELVERQYDSDDLGEVVERKPDDQDAPQRQVLGAHEKGEDKTQSRETSSAALLSKRARRNGVDGKADESTPHLLPPADGKDKGTDQDLTEGERNLATNTSKTKQGKSGTESKKKSNKSKSKSKNMIDNLFAGLA